MLSDTHLKAGIGGLPVPVLEALAAADVILHAGDVVSPLALEELRTLGAAHVVLGNNDHELAGTLPGTVELDLAGVRVAMVHDAGAKKGRAARLSRRFGDADAVVFGHSHQPVSEPGVGGQLLFNPGSPTQRRRASERSFGRLTLVAGRIERAAICPV